MKLLSLLVLLFALPVTTFASPTKKEALAAIATIQKDPWCDAATDAFQVLGDYLQKTEGITITMSRALIPWAFDEAPANDEREVAKVIYLRVYLAANLKSQLLAEKPKDDPYAGWIAVIRTYRGAANGHSPKFPSIEHLEVLDGKGQLSKFAEEALKAK